MSVFIGEKGKRVELAERKDATNPNLFTGSKDFTSDWMNLDQVKQKDKYLDFTAICDNWEWNGISQYIAANKGDTFTASAYVKANAGSSLSWFTLLGGDNEDGHTKADTNPQNQAITATGGWQKTSFTFTATSDGTIKPRIESDGTVTFWIAGMKLEKGTVATPWCPALEDYAWESDITSLQNTVNGKANSTDITSLQNTIQAQQPKHFSENSKPDTNNDFVMTFNDNSESKTRLRDAFYAMVPDGAQTHNNIFRGQNLGVLDATHIANIQNGTFHDMFIGDYFSINGSNYVIAGINTKHLKGDNGPLGNHLLLMPDRFSTLNDGTVMVAAKATTNYMNDTATTAGGFAGSKLYQTYMPSIQQKLEADFSSNLLTFREVVSTHVDASGAPDQGGWYSAKVSIPNEVMIYGTTLNGNNKNGTFYNIGDDNVQLPLFRLDPDELTNHRDATFWLRDICSASEFAYAFPGGDSDWNGHSASTIGVRAFFLIG